jgi:hypothetical protein
MFISLLVFPLEIQLTKYKYDWVTCKMLQFLPFGLKHKTRIKEIAVRALVTFNIRMSWNS